MLKYTLLLAAAIAQPALAQQSDEDNLSGPRIELRGGYESPSGSAAGFHESASSASIGVEAGYDVRVGERINIGPYVNYEYADAKFCDSGICVGSGGNLQAGGRLGIILSLQTELYVKAGYDSFRLKATIPGASGSETLDGPTGAIGIDIKLGKSLYTGLEFDYADLGSFAGVNFKRRHGAVKLGYRF